MDVGEAEVAALVTEGQAGMFDAHQVEDRRVEVVHMNAILDDIVTEVVGLAVGRAFIDTGAGHQHREASRMVVTAVVGLRERAL